MKNVNPVVFSDRWMPKEDMELVTVIGLKKRCEKFKKQRNGLVKAIIQALRINHQSFLHLGEEEKAIEIERILAKAVREFGPRDVRSQEYTSDDLMMARRKKILKQFPSYTIKTSYKNITIDENCQEKKGETNE